MNDLVDKKDLDTAAEFINKYNLYEKSRDMIDLGAYRQGSNPELDKVISILPEMRKFIKQGIDDSIDRDQALGAIRRLLNEQ
jgi:flagellum-specific ATP synthase